MVDNPQLLITSFAKTVPPPQHPTRSQLDAAYVPVRMHSDNLRAVIRLLSDSNTSVYLMSSEDLHSSKLGSYIRDNVRPLQPTKGFFRHFFYTLLTSRHYLTAPYCRSWDLPLKRSFALLHAIQRQYERVLFIDDDIRLADSRSLMIGAKWLEKYAIAGSFVDDFIDTSVIGHLERAAGEDVYPFLSGSFLFVNPRKVAGFFPCIYNEDWLFMIPQVLTKSVCAVGSVGQVPFDPFKDITRVAFQEFGDIIAEGLYSLIEANEYARRFDFEFWQEAVAERREVIVSLGKRLRRPYYRRIINAAFKANAAVRAAACQQFVYDWERDKERWHEYVTGSR
jgi:hypothetical protein